MLVITFSQITRVVARPDSPVRIVKRVYRLAIRILAIMAIARTRATFNLCAHAIKVTREHFVIRS